MFVLCCSASGEDGAKRLYPIVHLRRVIRSYVVATPTTVPKDTFCDCPSLASIMLPDSVTMIGQSAFAKCSSLTSITLPHSLTTIERVAFRFCPSLTSITVSYTHLTLPTTPYV